MGPARPRFERQDRRSQQDHCADQRNGRWAGGADRAGRAVS